MVNIIIIAIIFSYGAYTLFRHVKRSSHGKCGACELNDTCSKSTCTTDTSLVEQTNQTKP